MTDKWYNSYRWWYSRIGGRKWTDIIRDFYHNHPILWTFIVLWACYLFNRVINIHWHDWLLLSAGILLGHLFWGSKYTPNQGDDNSMMPPGEAFSNYHKNWRKP